MLNVLLSVAQWERETTGERTREALHHKIRSGQRCGKVRFDYDLAGDGKTLVPNPAEQQAIALMTDLRAITPMGGRLPSPTAWATSRPSRMTTMAGLPA